MTRERLTDRRPSITSKVRWEVSTIGKDGRLEVVDTKLLVTFGYDEATRTIREAFCAGFRAETGVVALMNDAMILYSRLLQRGETVEELARSMSENRLEGADVGPPASMMGAVLREAVRVQRELRGED